MKAIWWLLNYDGYNMTFKYLENNKFYVKGGVTEVRRWLKENIPENEYAISTSGQTLTHNGKVSIVVWFSDEANSVAFKLRWF